MIKAHSRLFDQPSQPLKSKVVYIFTLAIALVAHDALCMTYEKDLGELFSDMVDAYVSGEWQRCVDSGMKALTAYRRFQEQDIECREVCGNKLTELKGEYRDVLLISYASSLKHITCIQDCKKRSQDESVLQFIQKLQSREPYDFLQVCYYKLGDYKNAAASATTFLVKNPSHEYMNRNIERYRDILLVNQEHFIDLEAPLFESHFKKGMEAFDRQDYSQAVRFMLYALDDYHMGYQNCSLRCEAGYQTLSHGDTNHQVAGAIADQIAEAVKCKDKCPKVLSKLDLSPVDNILLDIYHYLLFSYHQVGDLKSSCEYTEAFLMHQPENATMVTNKQILMANNNAPAEWFKAPLREFELREKLDELSRLVAYLETDYISQHSLDSHISLHTKAVEDFNDGRIKVNATGTILGGQRRVVADGFATQEECRHLINLCKNHCGVGDGYDQQKHPHTKHEYFEGLSISEAVKSNGLPGYWGDRDPHPFTQHELVFGLDISSANHLVKEGSLSSSLLHLYIKISQLALDYTKLYFNLNHLFFDYTHLVCRTAVDGVIERNDLSHPVHSDNCVIRDNGECYRGPPAYTQRDFSALVYLNEDFEGGEFFFTDNHFHEQASVKPTCGRLVAFDAGDYHGVKPILRGRRCAIAMWFTLDKNFMELSRLEANDLLEKINGYHVPSSSNHDEL